MLHNLGPERAADMLLEYELTGKFTSVAREFGIGESALLRWLPYVGLNAEGIRQVKELQHQAVLITNQRDKLQKNLSVARRVIIRFQPSRKKRSALAAALIANYGLTRISANTIVGLSKKAGKEKVQVRNEAQLVAMMKSYLSENPGHGFRTLFEILLRDEPCGKGAALKLYRKAGFVINKRIIEPKVPRRVYRRMAIQTEKDTVWSMDFMIDALPNGTRIWLINVLDDFNREAVIVKAIRRPTSKAVIDALNEVMQEGRSPKCIRTDNGMQFKSVAYKYWAKRRNIYCEYSRPRKPTDNAYIESFNGTLRREVFDHFKFTNLLDLQNMLDDWKARYNLGRPHMALGGLSPAQFERVLQDRRRKDLN